MEQNQDPNSDQSANNTTPVVTSGTVPTLNETFSDQTTTNASKRVMNIDPANLSPGSSSSSTVPNTPKVTKASSKKPLLFAAILILILAVSAAVWYFVIKNRNVNKTSSATNQAVIKKELPLLRYVSIEPVYGDGLYPPLLSTTSGVINTRKQIFESLVTFQDTTQITPQLAVSWTNPDLTTWVFKLKPGVKFHNGTLLTAKIAKDSIEATTAANKDNLFTQTIKSITANDELTLTITTMTPDSTLLSKLTFIPLYDVNASVINSQTGTGPYTISDGDTPGSKKITLAAVENYHGGQVYTKKVEISEESELDKIAQAIIDGNADFAPLQDQTIYDKVISRYPNAQYFSQESPGANGMYLNPSSSGPLKNKAVRKAIYKALDMQKVVVAGKSPAIVASQVVSAVVPGFNPAITVPKVDVAGAKKDIVDAGYPNGFSYSLTIFSILLPMAEEIKSQLAEVGVTVNIVVEKDTALFLENMAAGNYESWISAYTTDINDASDVIGNVFQGGFYKNFYVSKDLNMVMDSVNTTFDASKRLVKLQEASKIIMDDAVFLPIRSKLFRYYARENLGIKQDYSNAGVFATYYWQAYQK